MRSRFVVYFVESSLVCVETQRSVFIVQQIRFEDKQDTTRKFLDNKKPIIFEEMEGHTEVMSWKK